MQAQTHLLHRSAALISPPTPEGDLMRLRYVVGLPGVSANGKLAFAVIVARLEPQTRVATLSHCELAGFIGKSRRKAIKAVEELIGLNLIKVSFADSVTSETPLKHLRHGYQLGPYGRRN